MECEYAKKRIEKNRALGNALIKCLKLALASVSCYENNWEIMVSWEMIGTESFDKKTVEISFCVGFYWIIIALHNH